jgi:hypothetical protein
VASNNGDMNVSPTVLRLFTLAVDELNIFRSKFILGADNQS